jgi:hypothetical protein
MLDAGIIRRVELARYLYHLAERDLASSSNLALFSGVNLLHDAVEAFLVALADYVGAPVKVSTTFEGCIDLINKKIAPKELPYRSKLNQLNKLRVNSKHYGLQPDREECRRILLAVREFFDDTATELLGVNFGTVSLVDLLDAGESKDLLAKAEQDFNEGNYKECLVSCRKAIFLAIEQKYDIKPFEDPSAHDRFFPVFCEAPFYARNKAYIDKNVKDPTDFIVLNYETVDQELMKNGVNTTSFWNVWRLTPRVYRAKGSDPWIIKYEFEKLNVDDLKQRAEYVLPTTIEIILAIQQSRQAMKTIGLRGLHAVKLKRDNVPVYTKADKTSSVFVFTPKGMTEFFTSFRIEKGLDGDGPYWNVFNKGGEKLIVWGYVHDEEVESHEEVSRAKIGEILRVRDDQGASSKEEGDDQTE